VGCHPTYSVTVMNGLTEIKPQQNNKHIIVDVIVDAETETEQQ